MTPKEPSPDTGGDASRERPAGRPRGFATRARGVAAKENAVPSVEPAATAARRA